jgi:two-component system invasion response regulator UvrY
MKMLVADDHSVVREGLKQIIKNVDVFSLIEEVSDGNEALEKIEKNKYDMVIMDISMPGRSGLDILKIMKDRNEKSPILILSVHPQEQYAVRAFKLGASGYLCKNSLYEELETAIKKILSGGKYISPTLSEKIIFDKNDNLNLSPHEKLSEREFQIMCMLSKGKMVKDIASELFISDKTVSTHRMRILEKMGMKNNTDLTTYAIRNGLIE